MTTNAQPFMSDGTDGILNRTDRTYPRQGRMPDEASSTAVGERSNAETLRIIYVEDHEVTRVGTAQILKTLATNVEILEAENFRQLSEASSVAAHFDLLLLDISLPDVNGTVEISAVKALYPYVPIVIFSAHDDPELMMLSFKAGASGFVLKQSSSKTILQAIQLVLDGEMFFPRQIMAHLTRSSSAEQVLPRRPLNLGADERLELVAAQSLEGEVHGNSHSLPILTPRQLDVLKLVAQGLSNKEIARKLQISVGTTKNHVAEILRLLDCSNRRAAICRVLKGEIPRIRPFDSSNTNF